MSKSVLPEAKIQLCYWHLRKAARERLSKFKLTTTPYNVAQAHKEFSFIDITFRPSGTPDPNEHEGGMLLQPDETLDNMPVPTTQALQKYSSWRCDRYTHFVRSVTSANWPTFGKTGTEGAVLSDGDVQRVTIYLN